MNKHTRLLVSGSLCLSLCFGILPAAYGMHIMEGYLPPAYCIAWGALCLPVLVWGLRRIQTTVRQSAQATVLLAMAGAYIFVLSSLKIPSVTGSCSHMTGTGLGAILYGPAVTSVLGLIVLLFQAILLAHGGLTTLGANCFSMAIAGPLVAFAIDAIGRKCGLNRRFTIFLAAFAGDLCTYLVTSAQLGVAYPAKNGGILASSLEFLAIFAPTQLPLAVIEGILTVLIMMALESYAKPELRAIGYAGKE